MCKNWSIYFGNNRSKVDMRIDSEKINVRYYEVAGRISHFMG